MTKGLVIAAPWSSSGKTTVSLALMAALVRRGFTVSPFKIGPDFIDTGHQGLVSGRPSRNLDGWMLSKDYNQSCFCTHAAGSQIAVVEGVMGLFDSADGASEAGSTAQIAKWLDLPVVLVVDASHMARSAAALVHGFATFDPELWLAGTIFNRVGSKVHRQHLERAFESTDLPPVLGFIARNAELAMNERHLGLVTAEDAPLDLEKLDVMADTLEKALDLDFLLKKLPSLNLEQKPLIETSTARIRLAVARDKAFCFYYQDNLDLLRQSGAELIFFSPMQDGHLPNGIHGIYLGGGYPELQAEILSANRSMRSQICNASLDGMPIYGECGGLIYLGRSLQDQEGRHYSMCGCLPIDFMMQKRLRRLGYRQVTQNMATILGPAGMQSRGHEFHYSRVIKADPEILRPYLVHDKLGRQCPDEGYSIRNTLGSYVHIHWGSCPEAAAGFVESCWKYKQKLGENHAT